jgi:hypothetical protein
VTAKRSRTTKAARVGEAGSVDDFLARLEHPRKAEIDALRALILRADERVREEIKWNAPSFYIDDHFATFKLRPLDTVQVVLHTGARVRPDAKAIAIEDPAGLLKWAAPDRCVATFSDMVAVDAGRAAFTSIVRQWIAQLYHNESQPLGTGAAD